MRVGRVFHGAEVEARLLHSGCEEVERNRGLPAHVAPVCQIGTDGLWAWLGFYEEWHYAKERSLHFKAVSMTLHFGYRFLRHKPQILRIEWSNDEIGEAAQPHWQLDVLESVRSEIEHDDGGEALREVLREEARESNTLDFSPQSLKPTDINAVVASVEVSRLHLASAAPWWRSHDTHMHVPADVGDIERWVDQTLRYTGAELARLWR